ncbi:MAG TPA: redoxin domain-containing protein [Gemmatimonadaceae bacterium]
MTGLKVGEMAPDFTLSGSTQEGLLAKPIHLAGFRGQTVVLAFFPKARTKG